MPTSIQEKTRLAAAANEDPRLAQPSAREALLREIADQFRSARDEIIRVAAEETHLADGRLQGEHERTARQLEMFAELAAAGDSYEAMIDLPDPDAKPLPRPDLRRAKLPRGPVAVFGAGNFPLAFGVAGGDTASALAAGCPVISKSHPGHKRTDQLVADLIDRAVAATDNHPGVHGLVHADDPASSGAVVEDPVISAVAFTGSTRGGLALAERAGKRDQPIPVYAEMGSLNPAIVTPEAAERGEAVAGTLADAVLNSAGQLCTKPGLILIPATEAGTAICSDLARRIGSASVGPMLSDSIRSGYEKAGGEVAGVLGVERLTSTRNHAENPAPQPVPSLWETSIDVASREDRIRKEVFGPAAVIVRYENEDELLSFVGSLEGQLAVSVFSEASEHALLKQLTRRLAAIAGRVVFDSPTTGVSVSLAQHHGGPFPATLHDAYSSIGGTATDRFVRPVAFQDCPATLLPEALQDANPLGIWRTVDGVRSKDPIIRDP